jgi:outer membrane protein TolC
VIAAALPMCAGCTRHFFRQRADCQVASVLKEKDRYPAWKIEEAHVYPDPRARFADWTNPDRPPKPPDDPATEALSPNPQRPGKAGIRWIEGTGYLDLLATWDRQNRQEDAEEATPAALPDASEVVGANKPLGRPYRIRVEQAAELGLVNSREYQDHRENLYLATLPVTLQRFAFAPQFYATEQAIRRWAGSETVLGSQNFWEFDTNTGFSKLFPTGALLLLNFANQTVINLAGGHTTSQSLLTLDLMQPFLRGGGFAVTLEPLTQSERDLVYEIRSYARFRKEFFAFLVGGANLSGETVPFASAVSGLSPGANAGLLAGALANPRVTPGGAGRLFISPVVTAPSAGYLPALLPAAQLVNDRNNVTQLKDLLKLFEAFKEGGDISQLQVDQVEQQLLQGQSTVLEDERIYQNLLDQFKLQLGVPTDLALELDDAPVRALMRQFQNYQDVFAQFDKARDEAAGTGPSEAKELRKRLHRVFQSTQVVQGTLFRQRIADRWGAWEILGARELSATLAHLADERRRLLDTKAGLEQAGKTLPKAGRKRLAEIDFEMDLGGFERTLRTYELQGWQGQADPNRRRRQQAAQYQYVINGFTLVLGEARSERLERLRSGWPALPALCVRGVDLLRADLDEAQAAGAQAALMNRLDLMNARAQVVDAWRQIKVFANALLGTFNVEYRLDTATPAGLARPFDFGSSRTTSQLTFNGELPLVRMAERNNYRAALIAYQRQRRALMESEDLVVSAVRSEIRQLRVLAEDYRIQQRQVELAYATVESSLDTFRAPPPAPAQVGQVISTTSAAVNAASLTQQLLSAQRSLPQAQNQLLAVWISYLTTRLQLYRDLELMRLDSRGVWIDDTALCQCPETSGSDGTARPERGGAAGDAGERGSEQLPPAHIVEPGKTPAVEPSR